MPLRLGPLFMDVIYKKFAECFIEPAQDLTELRSRDTSDAEWYPDKTLIYVEDEEALYRFDRESTANEKKDVIIAPDVGVGRWLKLK